MNWPLTANGTVIDFLFCLLKRLNDQTVRSSGGFIQLLD